MTDLHTHILPGVDDGAKNLDMSLALLRAQRADGVTRIALTPHFRFEQTIEEFLRRRDEAMDLLTQALKAEEQPPQLKPGAEIFYSSQLAETDPRPLCLAGTPLLLIEFPPAYLLQGTGDVLHQLTRQGFIPLIAHVERYAFVRENPNLLCDWIEAGVCTQMNASGLLARTKQRRLLVRMIRHGMIHTLATDVHSPARRPPRLRQALDLVRRTCGEETVGRLLDSADALFQGAVPDVPEPRPMRRILGKWM